MVDGPVEYVIYSLVILFAVLAWVDFFMEKEEKQPKKDKAPK